MTWSKLPRDVSDAAEWSAAHAVYTEGPSMTVQSEIENSDIHAIMAKHLSGALVDFNQRMPRYGDFTGSTDLMDAMLRVKEASESFAQLPSEIRDYCQNDPAKLLDLVFDPARVEECDRLGLTSETVREERRVAREAAATAAQDARRRELAAELAALGVTVPNGAADGG